MKRKRVPALLSFCTLSAHLTAHAASFGAPAINAVLGQPLQVAVPLTLDDDDRAAADCVRAEVVSGDRRLPDEEVRVQVQRSAAAAVRGAWTARITTTSPVDEPVLQIRVSAGCTSRFERQFTALADPPRNPLALSPSPTGGQAMTQPVRPGEAAPLSDRSTAANRAGPRRDRVPGSASGNEGSASAAATPRAAASRPRAAAPGPRRQAAATPAEGRPTLQLEMASHGPLLKMDIDEPVFMGAAAGAGTAPVGAETPASGTVTEGSLAKLQELQSAISNLQKDSRTLRQTNDDLRQQLRESESRSGWLPWIIGVLLLLLVAVLVLWRRARSAGAAEWWVPSRVDPPSALPMPAAEAELPQPEPLAATPRYETPREWRASPSPLVDSDTAPVPVVGEISSRGLPPSIAAQLAAEDAAQSAPPTAPGAWPAVPVGAASGVFQPARTLPFEPVTTAPREVSVEELLDLEQQADFFIALGQEDAALDLLMSYLRSTGGQSPVPYTKLLEIYRRQGDRSAYERIRARFNRRFNAYAPDWDVGPLHGRVLEDYLEAVRELEIAWPSPLNAMAVLEAMLFRKDESQELFDLPAYKDLLLMYAIARDLWQQGGGRPDEVDLLLPLGDFGGVGLEGGQVASADFTDSDGSPLDLVLEDFGDDDPPTRFDVTPELAPLSLDELDDLDALSLEPRTPVPPASTSPAAPVPPVPGTGGLDFEPPAFKPTLPPQGAGKPPTTKPEDD